MEFFLKKLYKFIIIRFILNTQQSIIRRTKNKRWKRYDCKFCQTTRLHTIVFDRPIMERQDSWDNIIGYVYGFGFRFSYQSDHLSRVSKQKLVRISLETLFPQTFFHPFRPKQNPIHHSPHSHNDNKSKKPNSRACQWSRRFHILQQPNSKIVRIIGGGKVEIESKMVQKMAKDGSRERIKTTYVQQGPLQGHLLLVNCEHKKTATFSPSLVYL